MARRARTADRRARRAARTVTPRDVGASAACVCWARTSATCPSISSPRRSPATCCADRAATSAASSVAFSWSYDSCDGPIRSRRRSISALSAAASTSTIAASVRSPEPANRQLLACRRGRRAAWVDATSAPCCDRGHRRRHRPVLDPAHATRRRRRRTGPPRARRRTGPRPPRSRRGLGGRLGDVRSPRELRAARPGVLRLPPGDPRRLRGRAERVTADGGAALDGRRVPDLGTPARRVAQPPSGTAADLVGAPRRRRHPGRAGRRRALVGVAAATTRRGRHPPRRHAHGVGCVRRRQPVGDGDRGRRGALGRPALRLGAAIVGDGVAHRVRLGRAGTPPPRRPHLGLHRPCHRPGSGRTDVRPVVARPRRRAPGRRRRLDIGDGGVGHHQPLACPGSSRCRRSSSWRPSRRGGCGASACAAASGGSSC